tara:strand:+ start:324 stop:1055 length:732 start_codon:yes stop_codon:yes gene_type:complete
MRKILNIGILTNDHDFLIDFLLKKINKIKNINYYLFISKNSNPKKELRIFKSRTKNYFLHQKLNLSTSKKIESFFVKSHNSTEFYKIIKRKKIDYLYNSATTNKISFKTIKQTKGIINIHPGILPYYRGCTSTEWSLFKNDPLGITAHFMDRSYDSGPIIKIKYLKFKKKDIKEYQDIRIKIYLSILDLSKNIFMKIKKGNINIYKQKEEASKYYPVIKENLLNKIKKKIKNKKYIFNKKNIL